MFALNVATDITTLLFTTNPVSWFGLIGFLILCGLMTSSKNQIVAVMSVPIAVLVAIEYLSVGLGWHSLIMFVASVGLVVYIAKEL
jgi:hypothetical protein